VRVDPRSDARPGDDEARGVWQRIRRTIKALQAVPSGQPHRGMLRSPGPGSLEWRTTTSWRAADRR
jgi:hypothetical protein